MTYSITDYGDMQQFIAPTLIRKHGKTTATKKIQVETYGCAGQ
jgi:hypothetical protein